jgi:hypothetical protein
LLISALFIATVSADAFNNLFLNADVGVDTLSLVWTAGTETGVTADIKGSTCTLDGLKAPIGGTRTYSDALRLTATGAVTFDIEVVSVDGTGIANLDSIIVRLYDSSGNPEGTLTVWDGTMGSPLTDRSMTDEYWRLEWEITWSPDAQALETVTVALKVTTPSP